MIFLVVGFGGEEGVDPPTSPTAERRSASHFSAAHLCAACLTVHECATTALREAFEALLASRPVRADMTRHLDHP